MRGSLGICDGSLFNIELAGQEDDPRGALPIP
jgi:hypothetical protein